MTIAREEIFGPVGTILPFDETDEALQLAKATDYGLAAVICSQDINAAMTASRDLKVGAVWVNSLGAPDPRVARGGVQGACHRPRARVLANTEERLVNIAH